MCRAKNLHLPVEAKTTQQDAPRQSEQSGSVSPATSSFTHQPYAGQLTEPQTPLLCEPQTKTSAVMSHQPSTKGLQCEPHTKPQTTCCRRQQKPWKPIPTECFSEICTLDRFPAGWTFNVYDGRLSHYFEVPSECTAPTVGAIRYVEHYNEMGPYSRFRFQVCHNYVHGKCTKGFDCTYIHPLQLPQSSTIHVNGVTSYETLPSGVPLFVHVPGDAAAPQVIPSEFILRTNGSKKLFDDVTAGTSSRIHKPQHCAHYQFKKVCNRGSECSFIHSLIPTQ